jgi:threonine/homoserine/homoserine lactone efflux protein
MPLDTFLALVLFAFTTSITPGPNNMMLFASGVNFGFRRTIPHMFGIGAGFLSLLLGVGLGLGALLHTVPALYLALKFAGGAYLVWIAWKIATSRSLAEGRSGTTPMSFLAAAAFQWVNPKAWVMAVTAMATYTNPDLYLFSVLLVGLAFAVVNVPSVSTWRASARRSANGSRIRYG